MTWSKLLKRVFKIDVTRCQACGAGLRPENCQEVNSPPIIAAILHTLNLNHHPPPIIPARYTVETLDFDQRTEYESE